MRSTHRASAHQDKADAYRPVWHFTPRRNWMNDPNGLVYYEGEYHLFYQYNPFGTDWGHMSWGHAVSRDLVQWEELPVAIPETDNEMIFSGCAIVDHDDVSGLGDGGKPALLAYYTAFDQRTEMQTQHLAYSHDRGRSFTPFEGNPILDLGLLHFRDPKVFRHDESGAWVMVVALPREHKIQFYRSTDLLAWSLAGSFGPAGATSGQWECPDLMLVPLEGRAGGGRWVLKVDVDAGFVGGGSGAQYFVGDFDGYSFETDPTACPAEGQIVDFGPDFYAAVSWSDLPAGQPGPVWVGWMSNHQTGRFYPTGDWRGAQSLPRTLFLFEEKGMLMLGQRPVDAVVARAGDGGQDALTADGEGFTIDLPLPAGRISFPLTFADRDRVSLSLRSDGDRLLHMVFDHGKQSVQVTRTAHPLVPQSSEFVTEISLVLDDQLGCDLWFDGYLCELFINGGRRVCSVCLFPTATEAAVS